MSLYEHGKKIIFIQQNSKNMKFYFTLLLALFTISSVAQIEFPSLSPKGSVEQKVGFTTIAIEYERPTVRGREIFGGLVPYKTLWRTGAGNCTKIKFDNEILINGTKIPSGQYSLFTIPDKQEWTIILNSDTTLYGTGGYDESKDVIRFKTISKTTDRYYESLTIDIDITEVNASLNISWANTRIAFGIDTQTDESLKKMVNEQLLSGKVKDPQVLAMGAEYYYFKNTDLETGLKLVNKALEIKEKSWFYGLKTDILTRSENYKEALETLKLGMDYVKSNPENWTKDQELSVSKEQEIKMKELLNKIENVDRN